MPVCLLVVQVFFIELICDDEELIEENIKVCMYVCMYVMPRLCLCVLCACVLHQHAASVVQCCGDVVK